MLFNYEIVNLNRGGVVYAVDEKDAEYAVRCAYEDFLPNKKIGKILIFPDNIAPNVCETYSN